MAQRGDGFQCYVAASPNRPIVVLFQKDSAHAAEDGGFVENDPQQSSAAIDWFSETYGAGLFLGGLFEVSTLPSSGSNRPFSGEPDRGPWTTAPNVVGTPARRALETLVADLWMGPGEFEQG